jgi:hypothetical protein
MGSQDQQALFNLLQCETRSPVVLTEFERLIKQDKDLSWFQDVVPELIPGIESSLEWVEEVRSMLWSDELQAQHESVCDRNRRLEQALPEIPQDGYNLRRYWRVIVEALQPVSFTTAVALDEISTEIGRMDCLLLNLDETWKTPSTEDNPPPHEFIVVRQVVQDKVLNPLIKAIHHRLVDLEAQITELEQDSQVARQAQAQHLQARSLGDALDNLRSIIIEEKGELASGATKKRSKRPVSTSASEADAKRLDMGWNWESLTMLGLPTEEET